MDVGSYLELKRRLAEAGYEADVTWAESVGPCPDAKSFAREHAFVVCNSGMKAEVAARIFRRVWAALTEGRPVDDGVFRNRPKRAAMQYVYDHRERLFLEYEAAPDKLAYLSTLPYIGDVIKYHLFKNLGGEACKPDRHLVRIASRLGTTPDELCARLSRETGDRIGTVDVVIWRAAALGLL